MERQRMITAMGTFLYVLLASRMFVNLGADILQRELHENSTQGPLKRKRDDDNELFAFFAVVGANGFKRSPRFWVDARSNHWIRRVVDGMLLQDNQFDKAFRMNRNSFETLHGFLGMYLLQLQLIYL